MRRSCADPSAVADDVSVEHHCRLRFGALLGVLLSTDKRIPRALNSLVLGVDRQGLSLVMPLFTFGDGKRYSSFAQKDIPVSYFFRQPRQPRQPRSQSKESTNKKQSEIPIND